jgi:hypothetical protein
MCGLRVIGETERLIEIIASRTQFRQYLPEMTQ